MINLCSCVFISFVVVFFLSVWNVQACIGRQTDREQKHCAGKNIRKTERK